MQTHEVSRSGILSAEDVQGYWRITAVSGGGGACLLALNALSEKDAYGVHIERCSIPGLALARTWRPVEAGFELLDASGRMIAAFRRENIDHFLAADGAYRMERAVEA